MQFIIFGLVVAALVGLLARGAIHLLTRKRRRSPVDRGPTEKMLIYSAAILGGPTALFMICWTSGGTVGPEFAEEMMMLGPALAMPASAVIAWLAGELLSGPTRRSWGPLIATFLAAEAGFILASLVVALLGAGAAKVFGLSAGHGPAWAAVATVLAPFPAGGAASAWAYLKWRKDVALASQPSP